MNCLERNRRISARHAGWQGGTYRTGQDTGRHRLAGTEQVVRDSNGGSDEPERSYFRYVPRAKREIDDAVRENRSFVPLAVVALYIFLS